MSDIRKFAVEPTSILHLKDANDDLMYAEKENGEPDLDRPMRAHLYGPGSKPYMKAAAANNNRMVDRMKKKGKSDQSDADQKRETAEFLAACTKSLENVNIDELTGEALHVAVYSEPAIGFVAEQVHKHIGDWSNFTKKSPAK